MKNLTVILGLFACTSAESASLCSKERSIASSAKNMDSLIKTPIEDLMQMSVSSSNKTPTCISQAPNTISSYSYKDIHNLGARTLADVLWVVAGMQVQIGSNNRNKVWARGVQSEFNNKIALYIDQVPIRDVFGGFAIDEEIPIESIEKIEIIRGPGAALYGGSAFSGVINISTFQAGKQQKRSFQDSSTAMPETPATGNGTKNILKLGIGEHDTYLSYGAIEQNIAQAVDVRLEGKWIKTDNLKPDFDRKGQPNSRSAQQELGYAHLSLSALEGDLVFNGTYGNFKNQRVDLPAPDENHLTNQNTRFSLTYNHQFDDDLGIEMGLYHTDTKRMESEDVYNKRSLSISSASFSTGHTLFSGFNAALNYKPLDSNRFIVGFDLKREVLLKSEKRNKLTGVVKSNLKDSRYENLVLTTYSVFMQDIQDIFSPETQLTVGLRYDALELFKNQFSYRLGLTHAFNDNFYAKVLYGTAYRAPNFVEFTRAPVNSQLPDVETMKTLEAQLGYQSKTARISLTGYKNTYDNFITRVNSLSDPVEIFGNADHLDIIGTELESQLFISKNWQLFLNASWSHAKSIDKQQKLPLLADWTVATGVEWHESIKNGELSFNNHLVIYGKRKDWQLLRHPNRNSSLTDGFAIWNSTLHYNLPIAKQQSLDFELSAHNILNKSFYTQALTPPSPGSPANFDAQYQSRQVRFSVSYSWE